jgi:hypothetical protein
MVNLEERTKVESTGLFALDSAGSISPAMFSLGEELVAEEFTRHINSGWLSISEAYNNYWSYVEDKRLWGLEQWDDISCRCLLPGWERIIISTAQKIDNSKIVELLDVISQDYMLYERKLALYEDKKAISKDDLIIPESLNFKTVNESISKTRFRKRYNPFYSNMVFSAKIIELLNLPLKKESEILFASVANPFMLDLHNRQSHDLSDYPEDREFEYRFWKAGSFGVPRMVIECEQWASENYDVDNMFSYFDISNMEYLQKYPFKYEYMSPITMIRYLDEPDSELRNWAIFQLSRSHDGRFKINNREDKKEFIDRSIKLITENKFKYVGIIMEALGVLGYSEAEPAIIKFLDNYKTDISVGLKYPTREEYLNAQYAIWALGKTSSDKDSIRAILRIADLFSVYSPTFYSTSHISIRAIHNRTKPQSYVSPSLEIAA